MYYGGEYTFTFKIDPNFYPISQGPTVKCSPAIFHPNIEFDGSVCVDLLREKYQVNVTIVNIVLALG